MAALPASTDYTGAAVTQGGKKTFIAALRTYIADLLGTAGTPSAARTALGFDPIVGTAGAVSFRNKLINGGAEVAQVVSAPSLTTAAQYGQVDMCTMWASGGTVTAGTLTQVTTASVGRTGKAARAAGVTLTGSGQISWRYRMEAADAVKLKNQTASFQISVRHDVGSNVNYTIIIRKANAADNFSAVTVINTGAPTAVVSATSTVLKTEGVALGDCSNGLEIEVQAICGAITTKNFDFTEWQVEEGSKITEFDRRPFTDEQTRCKRYYRRIGGETGGAEFFYSGYQTGGQFAYVLSDEFFPEMRATPTATVVGAWSVSNCSQPAMGFVTNKHYELRTVVSALGAFTVQTVNGGTYIEFSARL